MSKLNPQPQTNLFTKFIESFFAAIAVLNILLSFTELLPGNLLQHFNIVMIMTFTVTVLFALGFTFYWYKKAKAGKSNSAKYHTIFHAILRYWLAFSIATYGFAKLFKTQFGNSYHRADTMAGVMNGFDLTWNYFAHSYPLAIIIGCCQILGGLLLVFRRTTLLGVALLLPVMVNIVLINLFYDIATGAFVNSMLFTLGLLYLMLLRWDNLKAIFWNYKSNLPQIGTVLLRNIARLTCIGGAAAFIAYLSTKMQPSTIAGKWEVKTMIRNGKIIPVNGWVKDSTAWKTIYFEEFRDLYCCPNPYVFDNKRSLWLDYIYDDSKKNLKIISYERKKIDTINVKISNFKARKMQLDMVMYGDTIRLDLNKLKK